MKGLQFSGDRFRVIYQLAGSRKDALAMAGDICLEQTVEFPDDLIPPGAIRDHVIGRIENLEEISARVCLTEISFAAEIAGGEFSQFLNIIFGNISLKPGIRIKKIIPGPAILRLCPGPRFGIAGLRGVVQVFDRPLLATAIKPMGLSTSDLAELAYQLALGGIDIIKDDHGLADQPFAPFNRRVRACAQAVARANRETGLNCIFVPNITAPVKKIFQRARFARDHGAGGLLIAPGLTGFDAMKEIAADHTLHLPVFSHPAFLGSFLSGASSIDHYALLGQLIRLSGADAVIYPHSGGRFSFTTEECQAIVAGTRDNFPEIKAIFPMPGGGITLENILRMSELYGTDVIYLIGGGLHRTGNGLLAACQKFRDLVSTNNK